MWIPRHVPLSRATQEELLQIQSLWWNNYPGELSVSWARSDPQQTVSSWMVHSANRCRANEDGVNPRRFYVVCCTFCYSKVEFNLTVINAFKKENYEVVLGVDKLRLPRDRDDE